MGFPKLEDCRTQLRENLPKAHHLAIKQLTKTIDYYDKVMSDVRSSSSLAEINAKLGERRALDLRKWGIEVDPRFREKQNLPGELSQSSIQSDILNPIEHIQSVYKATKEGLEKGEFNYECEYQDNLWYEGCGGSDQPLAHVSKFFGVWGDIHICASEANINDIDALAGDIIHEASHRFGGTVDDTSLLVNDAHRYDDIDAIPWDWERAPNFGADFTLENSSPAPDELPTADASGQPPGAQAMDGDGDGTPDHSDVSDQGQALGQGFSPAPDELPTADASGQPPGAQAMDGDGDGTPDHSDVSDQGQALGQGFSPAPDELPTADASGQPPGAQAMDGDGDGTPDHSDVSDQGQALGQGFSPAPEYGGGNGEGAGVEDSQNIPADAGGA